MDNDHQKTANRLDEVDYYKIRLLNRNVDYYESQLELMKVKLVEAARSLQEFSIDVWERYGVVDTRQVDANTGRIDRDVSKFQPQLAQESVQDGKENQEG